MDSKWALFRCGSAMPFHSTQEGVQRGGYYCPNRQTTAFCILSEQFHRTWWKLQSDRYSGLGNVDGVIEMGGFFQVAIGLTLGQIELAGELADCIGTRQLSLQQTARGVQMLSLFRFGCTRHLP